LTEQQEKNGKNRTNKEKKRLPEPKQKEALEKQA